MAEAIRSVGFIGLGSMGGDQAREPAKLSLPLTVFDVSPQAMERFEGKATLARSEEHTSELQSLMRNTYAVLCLNKISSMLTHELIVDRVDSLTVYAINR